MDIEKLIKEIRDAVIEGSERIANSILESETFDKYRNSPDKIGAFFDEMSENIVHISDNIAIWFDKTKESAEPVVRRTKAAIYERIYAEYRKAGTPYGDNHEGFMKWVDQNASDIRTSVEKGLDKSRETILDVANRAKSTIDSALQPKDKDEDDPEIDSAVIEQVIDRVISEQQSDAQEKEREA